MTLDVQRLDDLDEVAVQQAYALALALVKERHPDLSTKRGVVTDVLLGLDAVLGAVQRANVTRLLRSQNVQAILEDPEAADPAILAGVLSNFRVAPAAAAKATGELVVMVTERRNTRIQRGTVFVTDTGLRFVTTETYTGRVSENRMRRSTDRLPR